MSGDQACFSFALTRPEVERRGTVYVDEIQEYQDAMISARAKSCGSRWCHMWAHDQESVEELHRIAQKIGLQRSYFQNRPGFPHYDLVPSKRVLAIAAGAQEKPLKEWLTERKPREAAPRPVPAPPSFRPITNPSPVDRHSVKPPRHIPSDRRWYNLQLVPAVYKPKQ